MTLHLPKYEKLIKNNQKESGTYEKDNTTFSLQFVRAALD